MSDEGEATERVADEMPDDLRAVVAEIEAEAQAKRDSGEYPPELERELQALFRDLSPERLNEHDFEAVLERAERASLIDIHAPIEDQRAVAAKAKAAVQKLILWYMDYVVAQLSTFAGATTRSVRLLGDRVASVEERLESLRRRLPVESDEIGGMVPPAPIPDVWQPRVADLVAAGATGRVLHVDAVDGAFVAVLRDRGVDAYGVTAVPGVDTPDLRRGETLDHLHTVAPGGLAALVLSGTADRLPRPAKLALAERAVDVLAPGGVLVLVGVTPDAWDAEGSPVERDLAGGRPFHAETWQAVLEHQGMQGVTIEAGEGTYLVTGTRPA